MRIFSHFTDAALQKRYKCPKEGLSVAQCASSLTPNPADEEPFFGIAEQRLGPVHQPAIGEFDGLI
jgi:hypothetical protein